MKFKLPNVGSVFKNAITKNASKFVGKLTVNKPDILIYGGVICVFGGTVLACMRTGKAMEAIEDHRFEINQMNEQKEEALKQPSDIQAVALKEIKSDAIKSTMNMVKGLAVAYGPAFVAEAAGIYCILKGRGIYKQRNTDLIVAYEGLQKLYQEAIKKREEKTDNPNKLLRADPNAKDEYDIMEDIEASEVPIRPGLDISPYARFFDEMSGLWKKDSEYNLMVCRMAERQLNGRLHRDGFVFLNDLYQELDIPRTNAGAIMGWMTALGDEYIDLGIYNAGEGSRSFVNGYERSILINPNCKHVIFNKL